MKILIPYFGVENFDAENSKVVVGGVEKFIQDMWLHIPGVHLIRFEKGSGWRSNLDRMIAEVNKIQPDLVVNHYIGGGSGGTFGPSLSKHVNVPIMNVCNISPGSIGSLSAVQNMRTMTNNGHKLWFVSEHTYKLWNTLSLRVNKEPLTYHGVVPAGMVKKKPEFTSIADCEFDIFTIGRCEANPKNPFMVHQLAKKHGLKSLVISNVIPGEYYDKNKDWTGDQVTLWNLPHDEVLKQIPRCKFFVSTCNSETYGIAALEALSYGLPLLLNQYKESHASQSICADVNHARLFSRTNFADKYNELASIYDDEMRADIINKTYAKNNIDSWISSVSGAFETSTFEVSKKLTLENFL